MARRLCESSDPACTGVAPCPQCFVFVMTKVVPTAMRVTNIVQTKEQAETFFRNFVESFRQTLTAKAAEANSGAISPPVTTPALLAYLEFRQHFQEGYPALLAWVTSLGPGPGVAGVQVSVGIPQSGALDPSGAPPTIVGEAAALDAAGFSRIPAKKPGKQKKKINKGKNLSNQRMSPKVGQKLQRGDLKRIAEKHAEQSLASGDSTGLSRGTRESGNDLGTTPSSAGQHPANGKVNTPSFSGNKE